jgi:hypothetical protein
MENPGEKYCDNYAKLFNKSDSEGKRLEREMSTAKKITNQSVISTVPSTLNIH